jgi:outer membrane protein assembly factor BamB
MRSTIQVTVAAMIVVALAGADWRQFRGPDSAGASVEKGLPTHFDAKGNVAWKMPLPGSGPSGPIVVGGRVFVTAATGPHQERLHLLAFDAATGKLLWERQLWATGHSVCNSFGGVAIPTPASDGKRVYAFYSSNDLACFDLDGNLQWLRGLAFERPLTRNDVGMGSSPLIVGDTVVVQMEDQGASWAAGIDATTGETRWTVDRERAANWTSPTVLRGANALDDLVLLQSKSCLTAHDPRTGRQVFSHDAGCSTMSSSVAIGDRIFLPAGGLTALCYDRAKGSLEQLWQERRLQPENSSPVVHEGRVYVTKAAGVLVCGDASSGKILWQLRLRGPIWSTPVLAGGHLYVVNHEGLVQVVRLGDQAALVGTGQIDKGILASPAVADGAIYFRSNQHLWKIAAGRP